MQIKPFEKESSLDQYVLNLPGFQPHRRFFFSPVSFFFFSARNNFGKSALEKMPLTIFDKNLPWRRYFLIIKNSLFYWFLKNWPWHLKSALDKSRKSNVTDTFKCHGEKNKHSSQANSDKKHWGDWLTVTCFFV